MTAKDLLLGALVAGRIRPEDALALRDAEWFDEHCEDVLCAVEALRELYKPRSAVELGKCLIAVGYPTEEAADVAISAEMAARAARFVVDPLSQLRGAA